MSGLGLWARRTWWWLLPMLAVVQGFAMTAAHRDLAEGVAVFPSWSVDWAWMLSVNSGATLLLSPTAAAATAFMLARDWPESLQGVTRATLHPASAIFHVVGCVVITAWLVQLAGLVIGSILCWFHGAEAAGVTLPWQALTGPAAVTAAVAAGACVGVLYPSLWSVPGVAIVLFVGHRLFLDRPYPELFTIEMATWFNTEARPAPVHLLATIVVNLLISVALLAMIAWNARPRRTRPSWLIVIALAAVSASLLTAWPFVSGAIDTTYENLP